MKIPETPNVGVTRGPIVRRARLAPTLTMIIAGSLAGCGSSSSSSATGGALDEFLGTWTIDPTSTFSLTCPTIFTGTANNFSLWTSIVIEPGTLSDLIETTGVCPFSFSVMDKVATVPAVDPFTSAPFVCRVDVSQALGTATGTQFFDFQPTSWKFNLLQPMKGVAPPAQMFGTATTTYVTVGATGAETKDPTACLTYEVNAHLSKIANH